MKIKTKLCLYRPEKNEISLRDFLKNELERPQQYIKKFNFSASFLQKEIPHQYELEIPLDLLNKGLVNPDYEGPPPEVLYEDQDILALHKPCGVHLHPLFYSDSFNLLSFLRKIGKKEVLNIAPHTHEKGWLYRLDRETSGVVVAAKKQNIYERYRKNFSNLVKEKSYLCLVRGECKLDGNYSLYYQAHSKKGALMRASYDQTRGRLGDFKVRRIYTYKDYHVLQVDLKTGLRHQIRAGLKFLGFPILGDELYGGGEASRLMLHAFRYRFHRENQDDLVFKSFSLSGFDSFLDLDSLLKVLHK